jgi:CubicO group peptidase (beta-lactamase class C family)
VNAFNPRPLLSALVRPRPLLFALLWLCACAGPAAKSPPPVASQPERATEPPKEQAKLLRGPCDLSTPAGAVLKVPAGFSARAQDNWIEVRDAEQSVKVALVEIEGEDCAKAVKAAWSAVDPRAGFKVEQAVKPPPSKGYDEIYVENYVERKDRAVAQALARRKGRRIWVALISGTAANLDRRAAQIRTMLAGMKAPGVEEVDLAGKTPRSIGDSRAELVAFIEEAMKLTGTPGLSIGVVEQGKMVLAEGFGVRELGGRGKVTPDTLMMIGSVTKSLTTLMMATLVDAGKLSWTAPVCEVDPRFRIADAELTKALTVEQLVCACAGLPRKDLPLILEFKGKTAKDVFAELARIRPSTKLKETFQYQNHMVAAGGYVAARAFAPRMPAERAYNRAMKQRVFGPMGMKATRLDHNAAVRARNRATPHAMDLKAVHHKVPLDHERFASYIRPSGGAWSTARDMARYVITELGRGVGPDGKRVASEANLTHRWEPQVKVSADVSYGLGWLVARHKGLRLISHGGGTMGFATLVTFLPDKGVGVVMISNGTGGHLVEKAVWARLVELWFGVDENAKARLDHDVAEIKKELDKLQKRLSPPPVEWIKPLLGAHHNDEIGTITIRAAAGGYLLDAGEYESKLMRHDRPDGKRALIFTDPPLAGLELLPLAGTRTLEMRRAQERYVFRRPAKGR